MPNHMPVHPPRAMSSDDFEVLYQGRLLVRSPGVAPRFDPLSRDVRLSDRVANQLLDSIVSGGLRPGDRLPSERDLAQQFAVSRTVVREAVRSLAGKGIIEARSGRGLTVAAVDASAVGQSMTLYLHGSSSIDYPKVHEIRAMLEVQIAGLAAERASNAEIEHLTGICDRMETVLEDAGAASREDLEFHRILALSTHNELFDLLLNAVGGPLLEIRRETFALEGRPAVALASHREILGQVAARDVAGARRAMRRHLQDVEEVWERLMAVGFGSATSFPRGPDTA